MERPKVDGALNAILTDMIGLMRGAIDRLDALPDEPGCGWKKDEPACDFGCVAGELCVSNKPWVAETKTETREAAAAAARESPLNPGGETDEAGDGDGVGD
jgi:hypothetical protein